MTRKERDECKNLVRLAKQQEAQATGYFGGIHVPSSRSSGEHEYKKIRIRQ